jgi:hypothetical protein
LQQQKDENEMKEKELKKITKDFVKLQREVIKDKVTQKHQSVVVNNHNSIVSNKSQSFVVYMNLIKI